MPNEPNTHAIFKFRDLRDGSVRAVRRVHITIDIWYSDGFLAGIWTTANGSAIAVARSLHASTEAVLQKPKSRPDFVGFGFGLKVTNCICDSPLSKFPPKKPSLYNISIVIWTRLTAAAA